MFPTDDDDDLDVEALRRAALQTLKKPSASSVQSQSSAPSGHKVASGPARILPQNRGRGRGMMRRGRGRGFGNFHNGSNQVRYHFLIIIYLLDSRNPFIYYKP